MAVHGSADLLDLRGGERRRHARLYEPFPVLIRGLAATGETFNSIAVLDNCSARAFYVRLEHQVAVGTKVFALIYFAARSVSETSRLRLAVRGRVVRTMLHSDGRWGVGVQFTQHRFL